MLNSEIILYWSDDDGVFVAEVPELPGCMTHGDTQEAVLLAAPAVAAALTDLPNPWGRAAI